MAQIGNCANGNTPPTFPVAIAAPTSGNICTPKDLPLFMKPSGVPAIGVDDLSLFAFISDISWDISVATQEKFINCVGNVSFETSETDSFEFDYDGDPTNALCKAIEQAAHGVAPTGRQMYWVMRDEKNRQMYGVGDIYIADKRTSNDDMGGYRFRVVNRGKMNIEWPTAA